MASMYSMLLFSKFTIAYISTREAEKIYKKLSEESVIVIRHIIDNTEDEKVLLQILLNGHPAAQELYVVFATACAFLLNLEQLANLRTLKKLLTDGDDCIRMKHSKPTKQDLISD